MGYAHYYRGLGFRLVPEMWGPFCASKCCNPTEKGLPARNRQFLATSVGTILSLAYHIIGVYRDNGK